MAHWIAIIVALLCLSGSSLSRSWVGFDDTDDFESWQAKANDYGPNHKSKYYSGDDSWESDEDYKDSEYENRDVHDKPILSNNEYYKDHGSHHGHGYHYHHQGCDHFHHGFNGNWAHHGHHTQTGVPYQPDQHWGHRYHSPSSDQPRHYSGFQGHHGQSGFTGQPGQNWGFHGHQSQTESPGQPDQHWAPHGPNTQTPNQGQPGQNTGTSRDLPKNNVNRPQIPGKDDDRIVFPDFNNQDSTTSPLATSRPTTTPVGTTTSTTRTTTTDRTLLDLAICMRACPTTPEYNPVCGTNSVTYDNPGSLQCARNCGLDVSVARQAPCPRATPQPSTTARPIDNPSTARTTPRPSQTTTMRAVTPTSFTNTNVNLVNKPGFTTIPIEILQSVFGTASPSNNNTEEPEFDIDKRGTP